jgi:hypothetical protein
MLFFNFVEAGGIRERSPNGRLNEKEHPHRAEQAGPHNFTLAMGPSELFRAESNRLEAMIAAKRTLNLSLERPPGLALLVRLAVSKQKS